MDITVVVNGVTGLGVLGLLVERILSLRNKSSDENKNNQSLKSIEKSITDLSGDVKAVGSQGNAVARDTEFIKSEVKGINSRCRLHMESQVRINNDFRESLKCMDKRVFDIATKSKE